MHLHFETLQLHAGQVPDPQTGSFAPTIHPTTAYAFKDAAHGASLFALERPGHIYSRISNPTTEVFENRMAALEGGVGALATASGHAAQFIALQNFLMQGDSFLSSALLYGGTFNQFKYSLPRLGINARFAHDLSVSHLEHILQKEHHKAIYVESISNGEFMVPEFEALGELALKHQIPLIVDNTFGAGGYLFRPIEWGAHLVCHSATKWIGGHGNGIGGVIIDGGNYHWGNGKYPLLSEPSQSYHGLNFWEKFGDQGGPANCAFITRARAEGLRDLGPCLNPFQSFLFLQGLETLSIRMDRIVQNCLELAQWLEKHPKVSHVSYLGLPSHPAHQTAKKYFKKGFGGVLSFRVIGGAEAISTLLGRLQIVSHMANLGDTKTLIVHPASTTHAQLSSVEQEACGIAPNLLRLSVGIEHIDDLKADFAQALN
ncbi:MAG: PLP-dependent transferase [Bacteroidales bacterium]|nr:PLP-dependent transferase [Bacteroidales bacterium]